MMTIEQIMDLAARHAENQEADIVLCRTRDEHIRVTARANEALQILNMLKTFQLEAVGETASAEL